MDSIDYRKDFLESVKISAASADDGTIAAFVKETIQLLSDTGVISDCENCFWNGTGKRNRRARIDAYGFDESDNTMYMVIADYDGGDTAETLTLTNAKIILERLKNFLEGSFDENLSPYPDMSTPSFDVIDFLRSNRSNIRRYCLFLLTDKVASERISNIPIENYNETTIEYGIWDMGRIFQTCALNNQAEALIINLRDYKSEGIPCLEAYTAQTDEYRSFLCILPGNILADIYDKYGSRLLESNVRSFLSSKIAVNKKIRLTILNEPKNFFAYNNGIAATATEVILDKINQASFITEIRGFQIVNGGQTTASLSNARYRDKKDLSDIFVQMKLTEINPSLASDIVPKISRSSNSQNKVSESDFFSNHPFHIRMEKISRYLNAPSVGGAQYETHWFYERTRGQYIQEQSRLSIAEKTKFLLRNPKKQMITKTDLSQVMNLWEQLPHRVSYGTQKNFSVFAERITDEWEKHDIDFNELYYKDVVSLIIIYRYLEDLIPHQPWYEKGYRAQIIYHSISKLSYYIQQQHKEKKLDLDLIWTRQIVSEILGKQLSIISKVVFEVLTRPDRPIQNVTEWSKRESCWNEVKMSRIQEIPEFEDILIDINEAQEKVRDAQKKQKMSYGVEAQSFVVKYDDNYWLNLLQWGKNKQLINPEEEDLLRLAGSKNYRKIPNEYQAKQIIQIREKLLLEGFNEIGNN
jgi:hypothetical protein